MPPVEVVINAESKPENLPTPEEIIKQCFDLGPLQTTPTNINGVRLTLVKKSKNDASDVWVKYGGNTRMGEARTQNFVAQYLDDKADSAVRAPRVYLAFTWSDWGYIVMEYIDGQICGHSDVAQVAAAVQTLIAVPNPSSTSAPGPVGGGVIEHPFFIERTSSIWYESVEELEDHINGILDATREVRVRHVSFGPELASHGLRLCPSDLNFANFMKDKENRIIALDFAGYSFLPPSFFAFALKYGHPSVFTHRVASRVVHPPSTELGPMMSASCGLVPYSSNNIGLSKELACRLRIW
ncbi:hypothetical protein GALMADRAFT_205301 [Galerina marginata CBS 339.88]|uniref:Aminoglycoside phosphotransferase domain-containing protein n=1 Tax=Galerina marginata (strain CBS 339.88) TaxID=685588 RepID=A0A067TUU8_GALM3|nr:hypothetical protein GALMADRAFT_205301 [Galerina marginata CBS 339.88]